MNQIIVVIVYFTLVTSNSHRAQAAMPLAPDATVLTVSSRRIVSSYHQRGLPPSLSQHLHTLFTLLTLTFIVLLPQATHSTTLNLIVPFD